LKISEAKGHKILVKCITDNVDILFSSLRKVEILFLIKSTTIKKYIKTKEIYYSF